MTSKKRLSHSGVLGAAIWVAPMRLNAWNRPLVRSWPDGHPGTWPARRLRPEGRFSSGASTSAVSSSAPLWGGRRFFVPSLVCV